MAFDGFVMNGIIKELNKTIIDGKVNKVYSPTKNDVLFNLYTFGKTYNLLINLSSDNCRICTTNYQRPNPNSPSNFCMLLRKHLTGGRISEIKTFGTERIVKIIFECYSDNSEIVTKNLYAEIMNRYSNIILTDSTDKIIGSLKYTGKEVYTLPESDKIDLTTIESFSEFLNVLNNQEADDLILKLSNSFVGVSKSLIHSLVLKHNIDKENYSEKDLQVIYNELITLINSSVDKLFINEINIGNKKDYSLDYDLSSNVSDASDISNDSDDLKINNYIDTFYYNKESKEQFEGEKYRLEKVVTTALKKCNKKLENIENKLRDCENQDQYRIYGELLNTNLYKISDLHSTSVKLENYYDNNNTINIPLDISISVKKNAEKYFKKYRKLKNAASIVLSQKDDALKEQSYLESILYSISIANTLDDLTDISSEIQDTLLAKSQKLNSKKRKLLQQKKKQSETFNLEKIEFNGYTIYIGKNNKQNEYLKLKFSSRNDIWFHIQTLSGSHVVLKLNGLELTDEIIYKCASIAKQYSKGANDLHVSIDYTPIKNIKKSPTGKPGMVIYNTYKTIII